MPSEFTASELRGPKYGEWNVGGILEDDTKAIRSISERPPTYCGLMPTWTNPA
jgi:hypothetical protein